MSKESALDEILKSKIKEEKLHCKKIWRFAQLAEVCAKLDEIGIVEEEGGVNWIAGSARFDFHLPFWL